MLDGVTWRRRQDWDLAAWVTAHMINISGKTSKKKITPDDLLGRQKSRKPRNVHAEAREILRRQRELDAKRA